MARLLSRLILVLALATLAGSSAHRVSAVHAAPALQTVVVVGGQPDDITADAGGDLIWGDLARGTVERLSGGHITTLARGLSVPEGVIALPGGAIVVAEQGRDRVVRVERSGEKTVLYTLQPVPGQEGADGIGRGASPEPQQQRCPEARHTSPEYVNYLSVIRNGVRPLGPNPSDYLKKGGIAGAKASCNGPIMRR